MPANLIASAREVAREVRACEQDFDQALARLARLGARMLELHCIHGISALQGRKAIEKAFEALAHGGQARNSLLDMHADLASLNVRELAVGDLSECPEAWGKTQLKFTTLQPA